MTKTWGRVIMVMKLVECRQEFFKRCLALNLEQATMEQYQKVLKRFDKFCNAKGITDSSQINAGVMREHIGGLSSTMGAVSIKIHYMTLKVFFGFLKRDEVIDDNPMLRVETPKLPKRLIQAFSKTDISKLLNAFDKNEFLGFRNYTIMCILFATGMRRGELIKLCLSDIYFELDIIKVIGKGNKQRNIPLTQTLRKVLVKYLTKRKEYVEQLRLNKCPYLIINNKGERLTATTISGIFSDVGKDYEMKDVRVSPHTFRHTFAKFFLLNGGDVFTLQRILGHSSIETTRRYVNLNDSELKVQNDKYNPFENANWQYY